MKQVTQVNSLAVEQGPEWPRMACMSPYKGVVQGNLKVFIPLFGTKMNATNLL